jgi:hypothetical protein
MASTGALCPSITQSQRLTARSHTRSVASPDPRGLHSSTSQLNLIRFGSLNHCNHPGGPSTGAYVELKSGRV